MKQNAITHANIRLQRAREALARLERETRYPVFTEIWSDFLLAAAGVYSKLETGSKDCPKSKPWFGRKKHDRKTDPLLAYMHQARNVDEHGLGSTTENTFGVGIGGNGSADLIEILPGPDGTMETRVTGGKGNLRIRMETKPVLMRVTDDRFGDVFEPPSSHLGKPVGELSPAQAARLTVAYLEGLVAEATELPQHT